MILAVDVRWRGVVKREKLNMGGVGLFEFDPVEKFVGFALTLGIFFLENAAAFFNDFLGSEVVFIAGEEDFFEA